MERYEEIEKSIVTNYRKKIWSKFIKGVKEFEMVQEGDKIAVCISGGKEDVSWKISRKRACLNRVPTRWRRLQRYSILAARLHISLLRKQTFGLSALAIRFGFPRNRLKHGGIVSSDNRAKAPRRKRYESR